MRHRLRRGYRNAERNCWENPLCPDKETSATRGSSPRKSPDARSSSPRSTPSGNLIASHPPEPKTGANRRFWDDLSGTEYEDWTYPGDAPLPVEVRRQQLAAVQPAHVGKRASGHVGSQKSWQTASSLTWPFTVCLTPWRTLSVSIRRHFLTLRPWVVHGIPPRTALLLANLRPVDRSLSRMSARRGRV